MKRFALIGTLRLAAGIAQFLAIIFIARILTLGDLGAYSLFVIFLGYGAQFAGLTFYTFVMREIGGSNAGSWPRIIQWQWIFLATNTALVCFPLWVLWQLNLLPVTSISWYLLILVLNVFNTQHENVLVATHQSVMATISLFIRTSWIYALIVINAIAPQFVSIYTIFAAWATMELVTGAAILVRLWQRRLLARRFYKLDFQWIKKGIRTGAQFTLVSIFVLIVLSAQRVAIGNIYGETKVGILHFFISVCAFGPNLLEATLYSILLPKMLSKRERGLKMPKASLFAFFIGLSIIGLSILYLILPIVLTFLGKDELQQFIGIFWFTSSFSIMFTTSRVFHHSLYVAGADYWLFVAYGVSAVVACISSLLLIQDFGLYGAGWSMIVTGGVLLIILSLPFKIEKIKKFALRANAAI